MVDCASYCHTGSSEGCWVAERTDTALTCCRQRGAVSCNLGLEGVSWEATGRKRRKRLVWGRLTLLVKAMNSHTQHEAGSIPALRKSSWSNQIINLQGLNYIASVHTYVLPLMSPQGHVHSFSPRAGSPLPLTQRHLGRRHSQHQTAEFEPLTGKEEFVHAMKQNTKPQTKGNLTAFWCHLLTQQWFLLSSSPKGKIFKVSEEHAFDKFWI